MKSERKSERKSVLQFRRVPRGEYTLPFGFIREESVVIEKMGNGLFDLNHFSRVNLARANTWHGGQGIVEWTANDWAVAFMGEAGELCNLLKKLKRLEDGIGNRNAPAKRDELMELIAEELADTFTYLDLLAQRLGIDLPAAVVEKFNEISEREGLSHRL